MFIGYANSCGFKPYLRNHYVPGHNKNKQILCLDGFAIDENRFYSLIEKCYNTRIPIEERMQLNFAFEMPMGGERYSNV